MPWPLQFVRSSIKVNENDARTPAKNFFIKIFETYITHRRNLLYHLSSRLKLAQFVFLGLATQSEQTAWIDPKSTWTKSDSLPVTWDPAGPRGCPVERPISKPIKFYRPYFEAVYFEPRTLTEHVSGFDQVGSSYTFQKPILITFPKNSIQILQRLRDQDLFRIMPK